MADKLVYDLDKIGADRDRIAETYTEDGEGGWKLKYGGSGGDAATASGPPVDRSGSIAVGGTAQDVVGVNAARIGFEIQNTSAGDLRVHFTDTASETDGYELAPGATYTTPPWMRPTFAISVWGATADQTYTAYEVV